MKIDPLKAGRERYPQIYRHHDVDHSMQLVFYSNYAGRLFLGSELPKYWNSEVYPIESIKEFDQISLEWRELLTRLLEKGGEREK